MQKLKFCFNPAILALKAEFQLKLCQKFIFVHFTLDVIPDTLAIRSTQSLSSTEHHLNLLKPFSYVEIQPFFFSTISKKSFFNFDILLKKFRKLWFLIYHKHFSMIKP